MKKLLTLTAALAMGTLAYSQDNSEFTVSGYVEAYYGFDFNKPADNNRPNFIYSHNRINEVNLNLGFIKGGYDDGLIRENLAVAF